ncbi:hypothetical protein KIL84_002916, partial [Mauremys mutica]
IWLSLHPSMICVAQLDNFSESGSATRTVTPNADMAELWRAEIPNSRFLLSLLAVQSLPCWIWLADRLLRDSVGQT